MLVLKKKKSMLVGSLSLFLDFLPHFFIFAFISFFSAEKCVVLPPRLLLHSSTMWSKDLWSLKRNLGMWVCPCTCVCMCIYMHVCACVYTQYVISCMWGCLCMPLHDCMYTCAHMSMCTCVYIDTFVSMCTCSAAVSLAQFQAAGSIEGNK